jgi:LPXTG-motif cell wall-anchored protein
VTDLLPTRPLSYVKLKGTDSSITMSPGETKSADSFTVAGYNDKNGLYYGFDQSYGKWVVTDANGIAISESASPIKVQKNAVSGETTFTAVKQGKCNLTYFIDENCYASMNDITTYTKNSALSSTAMVEITVEQPEETVYSKKVGDYIVEVHGSYTGIINAAKDNIEGDDKFDVYFLDEEGTEVESPEYYWKAKELPKRGITLDKNGDAQFTKMGTFHVQLRGEDGTIYSDWIPITVEDRGYEDEDLEIPDAAFVDADADTAFEITGSYTGLVGAEPDSISGMSYGVIETDDDGNEHKGHSRLDAAAYDKTGAEINVPLTWEAQETDGITMTEDGKVSFTKPGTYHVRAKSGEYFSDWYEIIAAEKSEEYSTIAFVNPDGKPLDVFTQTWGSEIKAPADPTMKGYIFKGWSPEIPKTMPADPLTITAQWEIDESVERVLVKANTEGMGNILNGEDYGDEPEFDYENPMQSFNANVIKGDSVILFANADEGWEFAEWRDNATGKTYSTDATITITADAPLDLVAVFKEVSVVENVASNEELLNWAKVDYEKKSGVAVYPEYVSQSDDAYVIAVKDKDGNVLDTYTINPKTGVGSNTASAEVNLPQTGMSGVHKALAGLAALMTLTGVALVKKSRKEDED